MTAKSNSTPIAETDTSDVEIGGDVRNVEAHPKPDTSDADGADTADDKGAGDNKSDDGRTDDKTDESRSKPKKAKDRRRVSVSVQTLLFGTVVVALLAAVCVVTWLYFGVKTQLNDHARQAADNGHAEQIALDYAVNAAKIDAEDLAPWKANLVKGTTPELKEKLSDAGTSMEQILKPLQWKSTAVPLVAKVRSNVNGIYIVDTFVGVDTKTAQAPEGLQSTATYSITIDSNHDWQISEVGGVADVVGQR